MYPKHNDPDIDKLRNHPAVIEHLKFIDQYPGKPPAPFASFRTVVLLWEEDQERLKQMNQALENRANNPPIYNRNRANRYFFLSKFLYYFAPPILIIAAFAFRPLETYAILGIVVLIIAAMWGGYAAKKNAQEWNEPFKLDSITLDFHPKIKSKQQAKVVITIQIPKSSDAHTRERLQFKIKTTLDRLFQNRTQIPTAKDIRRWLDEEILAEIRELRVRVFRHQLFEPEEESTTAPAILGEIE